MIRHTLSALTAAFILVFGGNAMAQDASAPLTADNALELMSPGWNLGNSLEAIGGKSSYTVSQESAWGKPKVTQDLMNSVEKVLKSKT